MRNRVRHAIVGLIAFSALSLPAKTSYAVQLTADQLQTAIATDLKKVTEFEAIKAEATKRGLRVWLFGGTAASFGHYAKWDEERKAGDTKYQPERFDYDYTNIYRSTQDMDLAVDGTPEQSESFKEWLTKEYPYFEGDKGAGWDVRSLKHKTERMDALLNDKDFSNQHTDSNSTGMIEITDPPKGEVRIRDVRTWESTTPPFFDDVLNGKLHFYYSPEHKTTRLYKAGSNPEITSVIRYLTKAFQYDLKIPPEEEAKIRPIIDALNASDVGVKPEYSNWKNWIEKHGKKLVRHAVDMEYASSELERLGLKKKLIAIRNDAATQESLAWWLNKEPLKARPIGQGAGQTARELAVALGIKSGQPIIVTHETNNFFAHESITKSHRGELNAFISRDNVPGEAAAEGNGFYTQLGEEGARGTKLPIRMTLNPEAREGTDFTLRPGSRYFVITNKNAVTVIPDSLNVAPLDYFKLLQANSEILENNKAVAERLRRRIGMKVSHLSPQELMQIDAIFREDIRHFSGTMTPLIRYWLQNKNIPQAEELRQALRARITQTLRSKGPERQALIERMAKWSEDAALLDKLKDLELEPIEYLQLASRMDIIKPDLIGYRRTTDLRNNTRAFLFEELNKLSNSGHAQLSEMMKADVREFNGEIGPFLQLWNLETGSGRFNELATIWQGKGLSDLHTSLQGELLARFKQFYKIGPEDAEKLISSLSLWAQSRDDEKVVDYLDKRTDVSPAARLKVIARLPNTLKARNYLWSHIGGLSLADQAELRSILLDELKVASGRSSAIVEFWADMQVSIGDNQWLNEEPALMPAFKKNIQTRIGSDFEENFVQRQTVRDWFMSPWNRIHKVEFNGLESFKVAGTLYEHEVKRFWKKLDVLSSLTPSEISQVETWIAADIQKFKGNFSTAMAIYFSGETASNPKLRKALKEKIRSIILSGDIEAMSMMAQNLFTQDYMHRPDAKDLMKLLIERADPITTQTLLYTFRNGHWAGRDHADLQGLLGTVEEGWTKKLGESERKQRIDAYWVGLKKTKTPAPSDPCQAAIRRSLNL